MNRTSRSEEIDLKRLSTQIESKLPSSQTMRRTEDQIKRSPRLNKDNDIEDISQLHLHQSQPLERHDSVEWNDKIEFVVRDIGENCKINKVMHLTYAQMCASKHKKLMYGGMLLGPVSGIISAIQGITTIDLSYLSLISSTMSFISGGIIAIVKFAKYDEMMTSHKIAAAKYVSLESNIRRQLALYRSDRVDAGEYLSWLNETYDTLFMASPLLPQNIYSRFGVNNRDTSAIFINTEYEDRTIRDMLNYTEINVNKQIPKPDDNIEYFKPGNTPSSRGSVTSTGIEHQQIQGHTRIDRTNTLSLFVELSRYNDRMMSYDLRRFLGFKK